jgi:hypothetical protein
MPTDLAPPAPLRRPETTFTIPLASRVFPGDPTTVTFSPITARDELDASRAALAKGGTDAALTHELVRRSVVKVDGKPVDRTGGAPQKDSVPDDWINSTSPQVRSHLQDGFMVVNRPAPGAGADFLASAAGSV